MNNIILTEIPAQATFGFYIIITSMQLESFDGHVNCQIHQRNHRNLFFSSYLSPGSRSVFPLVYGSAYFWGCKKMLPKFDLVFPKSRVNS